MKQTLSIFLLISFLIIGGAFSKGAALHANASPLTSVKTMGELYNLSLLPNGNTVRHGDVVLVQGFRNKDDGGGGFFLYDSLSTQNPVFDGTNYFKVGYNFNYDGMVVRSVMGSTGRWLRQWDRGRLNIRWFGGTPGNSTDCSYAFNAALNYAQFEIAGWGTSEPLTIFNNRVYTRPGKTIFLPSGRYYFKSAINTITYGVVIEGEGNMGASDHGTRILILRTRTQADLDATGIGNERFGFFRFYANAGHNSGGGMKNLTIAFNQSYNFDANVVTLYAPSSSSASNPNPPQQDDPAVSKWTAENVFITMGGMARRAFYMESEQYGGSLPWRIRDVALVNCWLAGASIEGQTILAKNVKGLHINGGLIYSGLGYGNGILPGILLGGAQGCANTQLAGVDLTHGVIFIHKKSRFVNVDCRYGKLKIYYGSDSQHIDLQVTEAHILNPRTDIIEPGCPQGYKCYWNSRGIQNDSSWD